jgi:very-short-patch-repair endonuclease
MHQSASDSQQNLAQKIKIAKWTARLADLGRRNPLIKFRQDSPRTLEILTEEPDVIFTKLTEEKKSLRFLIIDSEHQDITQQQKTKALPAEKNPLELITRQIGNEQLKRLNKLRIEARRSFEERGVNSLFLALGTLTWYEKDKPNSKDLKLNTVQIIWLLLREINCIAGIIFLCKFDKPEDALLSPLILVPVELIKEPRRDVYKVSILQEDVVLNPTLTQKLKQTFGIELPEGEAIQGRSYNELITQIRQLLAEQQTWQIKENIFLSLFSYAKAAMVRDIIENEARIFDHPILQAISGDLTTYKSNYKEPLPASTLDSQVKPEQIFQIRDADSTQQVVIEAAKAGSSFVVQGPPGTGKSQTIVNIIAELIGNGKSVLFVAEKATALSVVYNHMDECGLAHTCLNLHHSGTTNKRELAKNLSKNIEDVEKFSGAENNHGLFEQLISTRKSLNSYLTSLHAKEKPLNKSPFEIFGELLKKEREALPSISVIFSNFRQWNPIRLQEAKNLLTQLAQFLPLFNGDKTTIWAKSSLDSYSYEMELQITEQIVEFQEAILSVQKINQELQGILQLQPLLSLESLDKCYPALLHILKAPLNLPENWVGVDIALAQDVFTSLKKEVLEIEKNKRIQETQNLRSKLLKLFNIFRSSKPNSIESLQNKLRQIDYPARQLFGSLFNPEVSGEAELKEIEQALNWLIGLQQYSLSADSVQRVINYPSKRRELAELVKKYESSHHSIRQGLDFLLSHFDESDITDSYLPRNQITFVELESFLSLAKSELPYFQEWLTYKEVYQKLTNLGNNKFLDALRDNQIQPEQWFPVLEKRIYQICLDAILAKKPELKNFNFEVHERQIKEFSELDCNQLNTAKERLIQLHMQRWENWKKTSPSLAQHEIKNLKTEANKIRRHLPIRTLLNDTKKGIPNLVKVLKPCWMMSPLSVSQYIKADVIHFDVLIFDEASQLRTEDVIPSIIRSNQVIVIGDNKQLPPTSFFSTGDSDEDDEDDESYESVLDECSKFMFGHMLKWHYRSQDERLIAFSNRHFYESKLVTFPNPVQNPDLGVSFRHVPDGVYDSGGSSTNRREAQVVAQLALEHFQRFPKQSLGIIAFSEAQADAIREQIEILGKEYPVLETSCSDNSPEFFLKALENVQGDERDAIILSVGYARDDQGKLLLNFGPLNRQGGERRLNVAVTRAKSKITLVSSIEAGDIDLTRAKSKGAEALRNYLEYAASGGERLQGNSYIDKLHFDSPFEQDVYHALVQQGYTIRTQVGCSGYRIDLGVVNSDRPGEFLLGIECDGASYHSSPTARDRDRLRQQVLERLGWKIHRIWSTDWFRNKPVQVRLLIEKIKQLQ